MPIVTSDELFGKVTYQPLELGDAYGTLRILPAGAKFDPAALRQTDIVVLGDLPQDIPVVAGVISEPLQAPLGHVNVLCHNRHTPNMALRGATTAPAVVALDGKLVHLRVAGQGYTLEPATQAAAQKAWAKLRPKKSFTPKRDDRDRGLPALAEIGPKDVAAFGAKTTNLAAVASLSGVSTPAAFGLPMHAYVELLHGNHLDERIDQSSSRRSSTRPSPTTSWIRCWRASPRCCRPGTSACARAPTPRTSPASTAPACTARCASIPPIRRTSSAASSRCGPASGPTARSRSAVSTA
jgi:hypothetical protein